MMRTLLMVCLLLFASATSREGLAQGPTDGAELRVRKNILSLTPQELAAYERGVAVMKSRPVTDRTSWAFQANIHGKAPTPPNDPLWRQCEHGTIHFLTWHRAYLLEFERILRDASGDPGFTLPYWDWSTFPALPPSLRNPASPLYDASRSINNGALIPSSIIVDDLLAATSSIQFGFFAGDLENSPHGSVHVQIGGNMGFIARSANDPIFWLHHCNIDRVWDSWIAMGGGRANPTSPSFLGRTFNLAGADGSTVTHRAGDLLNSARLGYRYDNIGTPSVPSPTQLAQARGMVAMNNDEEPNEDLVASSRAPGATGAGGAAAKKGLKLQPEIVELKFAKGADESFRGVASRAARQAPERVVIEIAGLAAKVPPRFTYEVYLNLPEGVINPEIKRLHRVGTLNLFGLAEADAHGEHADEGHDDEGPRPLRLEASATIQRLREAGIWKDGSVRVTLEPVIPIATSVDDEKSLKQLLEQSVTEAELTYDRIDLKVVKP